jgi:hypothetical protein
MSVHVIDAAYPQDAKRLKNYEMSTYFNEI